MFRRLWHWLVAVGVLAVVFAVGMPVVRSLRESNDRDRCHANLTQVGLALHTYLSVYDCFPPGTIARANLPPERELSWVVAGWSSGLGDTQQVLDVDWKRAWDEPPNLAMKVSESGYVGSRPRKTWPARPLGHCPADPLPDRPGVPSLLAYVGVAGKGPEAAWLPARHERAGVFGYDRVTRVQDITDGTSNTMMVIETAHQNGPWTAGGPASLRAVDPATKPYFGPGRPFGGYHPGGVNVLLADGSVKFIKETINVQIFEAISTIAGGEVTSSCSCR